MKNLKRLTAVLAVSALCVGTAFTSFAEYSPSDPETVIDGDDSPVHTVEATDKDGNVVHTDSDPITDQKVNDTLKDKDAVKDVLKEAGFVVPDGAEVTVLAAADVKIQGAMPAGGIDMQFVIVDDNLKKGDTIYVLHYIPEKGIWEVMEAVINEFDGITYVDVHFDSLSPVAFVKVMKNGEVLKLEESGARKSPKTGM